MSDEAKHTAVQDKATEAARQARLVEQAKLLTEALPYLQRYAGCDFVIKYGGHAMGDAAAMKAFTRDVVLLKQVGINPVVVHGGGPQIGKLLEQLKIKSEFVNGLRVTDAATADIVEMVLAGNINKQLVQGIQEAGGTAVGLCGKDARLITARKAGGKRAPNPDSMIEKVVDLGFVGEPDKVDPHILRLLSGSDIIPVIAPVGTGPDGMTYNINADTAAGAVAGALGARRFMLLTDVPGVYDKNREIIPEISFSAIDRMIADGTVTGGMIPKIETCRMAVQAGVEGAVIMDGRVPHAVLLELFTARGAGTLILRD
ncbi:MAG: acetylglutamate kinase [Alphaproteobacteria bacterium]|nr:acetylglutamate kinase [Alphaproteobacteria bacterium]